MLTAGDTTRKIKVLIVDDSAIVRKILSETISSEPDMEVVGTAPDPYVARDKILSLHPDVLTLDIEMPRMDGITFLKRLMHHHPIPTIIVSSLGQASCAATLEALRCGAVDVMAKPSGPYSVGDLRHSLAAKIRGAAGARPRPASDIVPAVVPEQKPVSPAPVQRPVASVIPAQKPAAPSQKVTSIAQAQNAQPQTATSIAPETKTAPSCLSGLPLDPRTIIAIGASTGGTVAIQEIMLQLPADMPPMVVTQHIPAGFSLAFANRLNKLCRMEVREAVDGDMLRRGLALIAPGDYHMLLRRAGAGYMVELQQGPQVCYQRPSVDVMFASVAQTAGTNAIGVILTGMGNDGARGMLSMRRAGAFTIGQDEPSCVVYGMPREAKRIDAVCTVASLNDIPRVLTDTVRQYSKAAAKAG
jgi:two-component system chemotaxis response regulator CheB